ncbi:mannonate dehydratase [Roseovarius sp. A-2]|uniref:mannonate dehydratase n=1 Tax=Roseovarius sp. A-2 TaxID=1570360 RepID=UPI0009B593DE|nr:mannonate dehydratase [Roseovarius sp. A-2]GAW36372.1 mannonate dehydratase [Roseovarius sp. A-2]
MKQTWRWFGPDDPVTLNNIRQAGATGVVTALHEYAPGAIWSRADIDTRKALIEAGGLTWDVCESILMPDAIKLNGRAAQAEIAAWIDTMRHLAGAGVKTICYNFMPLLDWTRTDLAFDLPGQGQALRFDMVDFVVYDVHILARENAAADHASDLLTAAQTRWRQMSPDAQAALERNIIAGLPGSAKGFARADLAAGIDDFSSLSHSDLQANLASFLEAVVPEAEALGVRLAIHPDDPPFPLFGLPRCVSTADDLAFLLAAQPSPANGLTFCTGSLGARADNDLPAMAHRFAGQIHFAHLRNVQREADGSFFEAAVLDGSAEMLGVLAALWQAERADPARNIPMRPDHGHLLAFERDQKTNPGYSYLGRLKGLAELRGAWAAFSAVADHPLTAPDRNPLQ